MSKTIKEFESQPLLLKPDTEPKAISTIQPHECPPEKALLAVILEGVSAKWQMNVLQVLATPTTVRVTVDGHGTVDPIAYSITQDQARHLATQITEILGPERT